MTNLEVLSSLRIEPSSADYHLDACRLLAGSFRKKFATSARMDKEKIARLLAASWPYRNEGDCRQYTAFLKHTPVGTIAWKGTPRYKDDAFRAGSQTNEPSLIALVLEFGLWDVLRLTAGMAALAYTPSEGECYVEHVAVHSRYRGCGIGRKLMQQVLSFAYQHGFTVFSLHVSEHNSGAMRLYESMGFSYVRTERRPLGGWLFGERNWQLMKRNVR
ncbi:GNAT family N-acetyltransferase [Saccharibacillus sacchari]|uniref:GNAT family N-acetyltransferase n=1 Tax=Saccharibacillus sacchari TaxID=456493 RepID=UPI0004AF43D0|nr:GNAT family N-acetyltransferase [Saccharibacillus sacchari]